MKKSLLFIAFAIVSMAAYCQQKTETNATLNKEHGNCNKEMKACDKHKDAACADMKACDKAKAGECKKDMKACDKSKAGECKKDKKDCQKTIK